jgi:hypothetical protein
VLLAAVLWVSVPALFGEAVPMVHITWSGVTDQARETLESRFRLSEPAPLGGERWAYVPLDPSPDTIGAIVDAAEVAATDGIDRRARRMSSSPPMSPRRGGLFATAPAWSGRAAKTLAVVLMLVGAVLVAPAFAPVRRAWEAFDVAAFPAQAASAARAFPGWLGRAVWRGIPLSTAEAAGLFRIVFGGLVLAYVAARPVRPGLLVPPAITDAEGPYGVLVRWLSVRPAVVDGLEWWLLLTGAACVAGLVTRVSYGLFVAGFLVWACVFTLQTSSHAVAAMSFALLCLLAVPWGDAWSLDAWWRRRRGLPAHTRSPVVYGYATWVPGLVLGVAFAAAAWAKIGNGPGWILNGTVRYHFVSDLDHALVSWGPAITQYHWVAVALSASAVVIEILAVTASLSRSTWYRLAIGAASLGLLGGFALFQGVFWWLWWILTLSFLPWTSIARHPVTQPAGRRAARVPAAQMAAVALLVTQQLVVTALGTEARPLLSQYDMYSASYGSPEEYDASIGLVYRVVAVEGTDARDVPGCPAIEARMATSLPAAAAAADPAGRSRFAAMLGPCVRANPDVSAIALAGDRESFNWSTQRIEWRRDLDRIGPVPAAWLRE